MYKYTKKKIQLIHKTLYNIYQLLILLTAFFTGIKSFITEIVYNFDFLATSINKKLLQYLKAAWSHLIYSNFKYAWF